MIRKNKNLILFSGIFVLLTAALLAVFQKFIPLFSHVVYYCQSFVTSGMVKVPHYLNFIPLILLLGFVTIFVVKLLIFYFRSQSLKSKLIGKVAAENIKEKTVIIKSSNKFAFCLGIRKPKIYISTSLISDLSEKELKAVIEHERYHLEKRDTFINLIVFLIDSLSFIFPIMKDVSKNYRIRREIEADNFAVGKIGDSGSLLSAIKKILASPAIVPSTVANIVDHETLEERIHTLLSRQSKRRKFGLLNILISVISIGIISSILLVPIHANEANYSNRSSIMFCTTDECTMSCREESVDNKLYSDMPSSYSPAR